jgi:hypothetical protein
MFQRCLSVLLLLAVAPVLVLGGEKHVGTGPGDAPPQVREARKAVKKHLAEIRAPREACVLEASEGDPGTVRVCVWWPGDDQPTRLPVMKTFAYAVPSRAVIQEE